MEFRHSLRIFPLLALLILTSRGWADFARNTPQADWQQQRSAELMDMAASLDARTLIWHMVHATPQDFQAINSQLGNWKPRTKGPSTGKFDPGWGTIDLYMLAYQCSDKLTPAAKAKMLKIIEEYTQPGGYAPETEPHRMVNTNHPLNGTMALVLGGQLLDKPDCIDAGRARMRYFLDWLRDVKPEDMPAQFAERRKAAESGNLQLSQGTGDTDEYNSPTYQAVTLHSLAGLSNWASDREIAFKARLLQEYLFLLTCARYDPGTRILCGPYSRSYPANTAGVTGNLYYILHRYLHDAMPLDPFLANKEWGKGSADIYWIPKLAQMPYYFPDYLRPIAEKKQYPYTVRVSTKAGDWGDYPYEDQKTKLYATGGRSDLTSYLTEDYCLGSSSRYYLYGGQNENCILYFRKRPVNRPQDRKFLIFRYLIDNRDPFENVRDGLPHVYQHENRAIVLFHPAMRPKAHTMRAWAGLLDGYEPVDSLYIDDKPVTEHDLPCNLSAGQTLFVHDGNVHIAIRPLVGQNLGIKQNPIRLEREKGCLGLSAYNYQSDEPLPLSLQKVKLMNPLRFIRGGFALEVSDTQRDSDFAAFRKRVMASVLQEEIQQEKIRTVTWTHGQDRMAIRYDMDNDVLLSRTLNNEPEPAPALDCPDAKLTYTGKATVHGAMATGLAGLPLILASPGDQGPFIATKPVDQPAPLSISAGSIRCQAEAFGCGQVRLYPGAAARVEIDQLTSPKSVVIQGRGVRVIVNGEDQTARLRAIKGSSELNELSISPHSANQ